MKQIKNIVFISLLFAFSVPVFGQESQDTVMFAGSESADSYWCQPFLSNWYTELGGGAQLLFSDDVSNLTLKQRITPAINISVGKWFSPFWGACFKVSGYALNGFSDTDGLYIADKLSTSSVYGQNDPVRNEVTIRPDGSYRHYLRYVNLEADFQVSLLQLIRGYKENRCWDIIPSVGLGYFRTFEYKGTPVTNNISTNFGLAGKCRITKVLDLKLAAYATLLPGTFDGRITGDSYEQLSGVTLGICFHLGKQGFRSKPFDEQIDTLANLEKLPITLHDTIYVEKSVILEKAPELTSFTLSSIRFKYADALPMNNQEIQFVNIALFLQQNKGAKICLEGYGDKRTGTVDGNLRLSMQRAENIKDILVKKYKVEANRIQSRSLGSSEQPYENGDWNRVVIVKVAK